MKKSFFRRGGVLVGGLVLVGVWIGLIGPWPVDRTADDTLWSQAVKHAEQVGREWTILPAAAPLRAGWAVKQFELPGGVPLAGYGNRRRAGGSDPAEPLGARAMALEAGGRGVVLLMADLLIVNEALAGAVRRRVEESLGAERAPLLIFTATHTHSGPGGWGGKWVEKLTVAGPFDPLVFENLVETLTVVALKAWNSREPSALALLRTEAPDLLRNRTVKNGAADGTLEVLAVRRLDSGEMGMVVIFGGHATTLGASHEALSRDYPGFLVDALERQPGVVFAGFAAGCVGSQSCAVPGQGLEKPRRLGEDLAGWVERMVAGAEFRDHVRMRAVRLEVTLRDLEVRLSRGWKLSPFLSRQLHAGPVAFDGLRVDDWMWVSLPVELSGMLSTPLRERAAGGGIALTLTPFNGAYLGYLLPDDLHEQMDLYEVRMSFLGPSGGRGVSEIVTALLPTGLERGPQSEGER